MIKPRYHVIGAVVAAICLTPTLILALREDSGGRGAETYTNVYRLAIHYTSLLIIFGFTLLVLLAALIGRLLYFWRLRRDARAVVRWIETQSHTSGRRDEV